MNIVSSISIFSVALLSTTASPVEAQLFRRSIKAVPQNVATSHCVDACQTPLRCSYDAIACDSSRYYSMNVIGTTPNCEPLTSTVCVDSCIAYQTCEVSVPYKVMEPRTVSGDVPGTELREEIKRVKSKLDSIQPGPNPSLQKLQDDLREIKELLKKNATPTSGLIRRVEEAERIVRSVLLNESRKWMDESASKSVIASLVSIDRDRVTLQRLDGRGYQLPIARLSNADREFVNSKRID